MKTTYLRISSAFAVLFLTVGLHRVAASLDPIDAHASGTGSTLATAGCVESCACPANFALAAAGCVSPCACPADFALAAAGCVSPCACPEAGFTA